MPEQLHWTAGVHHDGSLLYVSNPTPALGDTVTIRLRTPANAPIRNVYFRGLPDGEALYVPMTIDHQDEASIWWESPLRITMPVNLYRFRLITDTEAYYYNGLGPNQAETTELFDFKLLADYQEPAWVNDSVFYHIFVDRFFNGDFASDVPPGAWSLEGFTTQRRAWGAEPLAWIKAGNLDFYGGDLPGIAQKLDYLQDLGVNTLYLSPIFTAHTNHRYDTVDFKNVDPYVGGNQALIDLRQALDRAGMHLVLDIVVNHVGWRHPWFTAVQADPTAESADYFIFHQYPDQYESWLGHASLVKLNYRSEALRRVLYGDPDSILRHWVREPYRIDGWRLDVFHMMARQGAVRLEHKIARQIRRALKSENPQVYLYGEHSYDGSPHLQGDELDGVMNYQGFSIPLRRWMTTELGSDWPQAYFDPQILPGEALATQWRYALAAIPWVIARQQYHFLGSHDIARLLTVLHGDKALMKLGTTILMTYPGVPSVYYGDEIGMEGGADPQNRRCMIWDSAAWDHAMRAHYQKLIRLRRTAPALIRGGFQQLYAQGDLIAFQRQSPEQRLIVVGWRGADMPTSTTIPIWHSGLRDGARLVDLLGGGSYAVRDGMLDLGGLSHGMSLVLDEQT